MANTLKEMLAKAGKFPQDQWLQMQQPQSQMQVPQNGG